MNYICVTGLATGHEPRRFLGQFRLLCLGLAVWVAAQRVPTGSAAVCISELMYRPAGENSKEEFIELHNTGDAPVDLRGWRFTTGIRFTFPSVQIPAGGYLVVAADLATFSSIHPDVTNVVGGWDGILSNSGQLVELVDASGRRVDAVRYADAGDWSMRILRPPDYGHRGLDWHSPAEGGGASLELRNPMLPNEYGQNWGPSVVTNGTPGRPNSIASHDIPPMILEPRQFPLLPRSTDRVTLSVRIVDELKTGVNAQLHYRVDGEESFNQVPMYDDGAHDDGTAGDGIFATTIGPHPDGSVIEFYFEATDAAGNRRVYPVPVLVDGVLEQRANLLYQVQDSPSSGDLPEYRLILRKADLEELRAINSASSDESRSHAEFNGTFISIDGDGVRIRYLVDIRNRGNGSRNKRPQSFRVNFRSDELWKSVAAINLNSQYSPAQLFGSVLYRRAGLPCQSSRPVQVRVNGVPMATSGPPSYGFYVANEVINSEFAAHVFPEDSSGNLYRGIRLSGNGADLHYEGEDPAPYRLNYFKQSNTSEDDWRDLIELTRVLTREPNETYAEAVRRVIDVEEWMLYFALETLVDNRETNLANGNNGDGKGDDYFLYSGKVDPRFKVIPYDLDTILNVGDQRGVVTDGLFRMNSNPQLAKLMTHPDFAPIYYAALLRLIETIFAPEIFDSLVDQTLDGLAPESLISGIKEFAAARRNFVASQIPKTIVVTNAPPATNGYPWTVNRSVSLAGLAPACETRAVTVNGQPAQWTAWRASWSATNVALRPGINRILVQAFGADGREIAREWVVVWCESSSGTSVSGALDTDTAWTPSGAPYFVSGSFNISRGVTLRIEPGTAVCFEPGASLVVADGGCLIAEGTDNSQIAFVRKPGGTGRWNGIKINGSVGSPESRLSNVYLEGYESPAIHAVGGTIYLDRAFFGTTDRQYLSLDASSFVVRDCVFPSGSTAFELVHGTGGIKQGGRGLFYRNFFGATQGYSDVVDFTGGNRPGEPIVEFIDNVFIGTSDDHLDLDGTDAWIEGNIFLHAHKNGSPDTASGVSGGNSGNRTSEVTIIRNIFYDCDQAAMAKQGNFYVLLNNTIVHQSHLGGLDTDGAVICLADEGTAEGAGMYLEGNVIYDVEKLTRNHTTAQVTFNNNLLPMEWVGPGSGNIVSAPMFLHVPDLPETYFNSWADAQVMWQWFTLRPNSPGKSMLNHCRDLGAVVSPGVFLVGEPEPVTAETSVRIEVRPNIAAFGVPSSGWPLGAGYTHYRWRLDESDWSKLLPLSEPIVLTDLPIGRHRVEVIGLRDSGYVQGDVAETQDPFVTRTREWLVDPSYVPEKRSRLQINEVLALNKTVLLDGETPDFVELFNNTDADIDISGVGITTDPAKPYAFVFASGTVVPAKGYIVVIGGEGTPGARQHLGFGLSQKGEALFLFDSPANGGTLLDAISWGLQVPDFSIGRLPTGTWGLTRPTPGEPNVPQPTADASALKINEWLASPGSIFRDSFIELYNTASLPVELSGLCVSALPVCPVEGRKCATGEVFPPLSYIAARGYVRLLADERVNAGYDHLPFKLSADDGAISLVDLDLSRTVKRVIDCVVYGPQTPDVSQGRTPDGSARFVRFEAPTPGSPNPTPAEGQVVTVLTFPLISWTNSWRYWQNGDAGTAWREETFDDSDWPAGESPFGRDPDATVLPLNTPLAIGKITYYFRTKFYCPTNLPGMFLRLYTYIDDGAALWLNGAPFYRQNLSEPNPVYSTVADSTVNNAVLLGPYDLDAALLKEGTNTLAVEVHQRSATSADVIFAIRLEALATVTNTVDPGPLVFLNEVLASNRSFTNAAGRTSDYVELINLGDQDVDLAGWSLTDDPSVPRRFVFPSGSAVPANGYLVVECEVGVPPSATNSGFDISANGGALYLFGPTNAVTPVDLIRFGLQVPDLSIGRTAKGKNVWALNVPTPGRDNVVVFTGNPFVLRINEWMAAPTSGDDWFELYNPGPAPVDIGGLYLTDDLTDRTRHQLPLLSFISTGEMAYVKLIADGNASRGANHVNFKLSASGEELGLFTESGVMIDAVVFGPQSPGVSEGRCPDGSSFVTRLDKGPSPAAPNCPGSQLDSDADGMPDAWEWANGLDPFDPSDAALDNDGDGLTNLQEFWAGTLPNNSQSVIRFSAVALREGTVFLRFRAAAGRSYVVQALDDLAGDTWTVLAEVRPVQNDSEVEVTDVIREAPTARFYRLKLLNGE